jgi:hypothetical protein
MKKIIVLLAVFITMSCTKEKNEPDSFVLNVNVEINFLNKAGNDLLNPLTSSYLSLEGMQLYYLINDEIIEAQVYDPQIGGDDNKGMMLITETTPYRLRIFTPENNDEFTSETDGIKYGTSITYLELTENDTDTIKTEWSYKEGKYFVIDKVWYNDLLQESVDSVITVVK